MKPRSELFGLEQTMATCHTHKIGLSDALIDLDHIVF